MKILEVEGEFFAEDGRRLYPVACPHCGAELLAPKSAKMLGGINEAVSFCYACYFPLTLEMSPDLDGDEMKARSYV